MNVEEARLRLRLAADRLKAAGRLDDPRGTWAALADALAAGFLAGQGRSPRGLPVRLVRLIREWLRAP